MKAYEVVLPCGAAFTMLSPFDIEEVTASIRDRFLVDAVSIIKK